MIQAQLQTSADGTIVFDATIAAPAGGTEPVSFEPGWFDASFWRAQDRAKDASAGRGSAVYVNAPFGRCVLRHYRRGGLIARVLGDRYIWTGAGRTRGFAEFHLLVALRARDLRVPVPVAARYRRNGMYYRTDLITRRIDDAATLAEHLAQNRCDATIMARVGTAIADFHAAGAYHADLNAHNILIDSAQVWLIDFDRGRLRDPARRWQRANLSRLQRSLYKLGAAHSGAAIFERMLWMPLMVAYEQQLSALASAQT